MDLRYHEDADTGLPHVYGHGVTEDEVEQVLRCKGDETKGTRGSRIKVGQTDAGRYLQVIYVPDEIGDGAFVVTAFDLKGKAKRGYRRRRQRRGK